MTQSHPTLGVAATKLPKERLAQLDRLAHSRGTTRSALIRQTLEDLLDGGDQALTDAERRALAERRLAVEAKERLAIINERLRQPMRISQAQLRASMRMK